MQLDTYLAVTWKYTTEEGGVQFAQMVGARKIRMSPVAILGTQISGCVEFNHIHKQFLDASKTAKLLLFVVRHAIHESSIFRSKLWSGWLKW